MKQALQLKATIDGMRTLKDRSLKITIVTQELNPESSSKLLSLQNSLCDVLINDIDLTEAEIEMVQNTKWNLEDVPNFKSPSQRLRAVFYRMWEQNKNGYDDFNLFYLNRMEQLIEFYKLKIE